MAPRKATDDQKKIDFLFLCIKESKNFKTNWAVVGETFKMPPEQAEKQLADWRKGFRIKKVEEYMEIDAIEDGNAVDDEPKKVKAGKDNGRKRRRVEDSDSDLTIKDDIPARDVKPMPKNRKDKVKKEKAGNDTVATAVFKDIQVREQEKAGKDGAAGEAKDTAEDAPDNAETPDNFKEESASGEDIDSSANSESIDSACA